MGHVHVDTSEAFAVGRQGKDAPPPRIGRRRGRIGEEFCGLARKHKAARRSAGRRFIPKLPIWCWEKARQEGEQGAAPEHTLVSSVMSATPDCRSIRVGYVLQQQRLHGARKGSNHVVGAL